MKLSFPMLHLEVEVHDSNDPLLQPATDLVVVSTIEQPLDSVIVCHYLEWVAVKVKPIPKVARPDNGETLLLVDAVLLLWHC